jgi:predicted enzyme related to lactoylglutathione lyase
MPNPVVHFEVLGKDGKKSQEFYTDLFGWHLDANNPMSYGIVDTRDEGINGGIAASDGPPRVTFYVRVDDINAYLKKAESLGGKTVMPRTEGIPDAVTLALFSDLDGLTIGLVEPGMSQ